MEIPWDQIIELISFVYKICVSRYIRINQETTTILTEMLNAAMCKWDSILYFENFWHIFLQSVKFYIVLYFRWPFFGRVTEFISFLPGLEIKTAEIFRNANLYLFIFRNTSANHFFENINSINFLPTLFWTYPSAIAL